MPLAAWRAAPSSHYQHAARAGRHCDLSWPFLACFATLRRAALTAVVSPSALASLLGVRMGEWGAASLQARLAASIHPSSPDAWAWSGYAADLAGNMTGAEEAYRRQVRSHGAGGQVSMTRRRACRQAPPCCARRTRAVSRPYQQMLLPSFPPPPLANFRAPSVLPASSSRKLQSSPVTRARIFYQD